MRTRMLSFILILGVGTAPLSAQSFFADQFQLLQPGLTLMLAQDYGPTAWTCPVWTSFSCSGIDIPASGEPAMLGAGTDAVGSFYHIVRRTVPQEGLWCASSGNSDVYDIERRTQSGVEVIVRVPYCVFATPPQGSPIQYTYLTDMHVDAVSGYLYIAVEARRDSVVSAGVVRISGLPTLLDIILSYQPPSTLSFNVPVHPEGFAGADSFSVYAGDVRTAPDLSQAVPLQCTVPTGRPPVPGEQLTVPDTLPDPAPGESRYYLAAVNYQGQRRAGRSSIGGVFQGRTAAALPGCL